MVERILELQNGRLVKVDGARPEYMSGQQLIELARDLADRITELEAQLAERPARQIGTIAHVDHGKTSIAAAVARHLSALEATPPAPKVTEIEWHRLVDGDPERTGRYIVGHRGMSASAIYHDSGPLIGWDRDVTAFTHWAVEPRAPDDGTPQLFKPEGQRLRKEALEIASWNALTAAQEAGKP